LAGNLKKKDHEDADFPIDDLLDEYDDDDHHDKGDKADDGEEKVEKSQQEKIDKFLDNLTKVKVEGK